MDIVKLYWQNASDENIRGYYIVNSQGVRTKVDNECAERLKETMVAHRVESTVMTPYGVIYETVWTKN